ncbi:co-chaperone YbbN [Amylibacter kogurei]|uniref:Co-chaperone YbbN n=1 Tax=Paramylibacter kogurei TaxID=1889778 RepID=A0A2G5K1T5_9RHOB|nr:co-chaperone YbbN [Amylibacter kogurei]PIB23079.1 co-chaperone YbbN [Amylibacter kogurei]
MLNLGNASTPTDFIKDASEETFMADVIEASKETPVIVDFWAPWCGPCKTLGPALEAEVNAAGGKVKMVKIDVDQNQMLAQQMRVQSIPAVFAFVDGQPVDGFMGAKSGSEVKEFVAKTIAAGGDGPGDLSEAITAANEMLEQGEITDAAEIFAAVLEQDGKNGEAFSGLIRAQIAAGDGDAAKEMLDTAPADLANLPAVLALKAQLELAQMANETGETAELESKLTANPDDHQTRFDLALAQLGAGNSEAAIETLLELFRRDREWNDAAAKTQLFKIFDSLGPEDALAQNGRRKLSSMIFA